MSPNRETGKPASPRRPQPIMDMIPAGYGNPKPAKLPEAVNATNPHGSMPKPAPAIVKTEIKPEPKTISKNKTSGDLERPSAVFILTTLMILLVVSIGAAVAYYFVKYKPAHKPAATIQAPKKTVDNTNHITDDIAGVKFAISKDLTPIDKTVLIKQNPSFIYGFSPKDVPTVKCIVSQSKRDKPGQLVAPESLKTGTLKEIKSKYPDTKLIDYSQIRLANDNYAANLTLIYTDEQKSKIKEQFVVSSTKDNIYFAFCMSPEPLFDFYKTKFDQFFESLEVY